MIQVDGKQGLNSNYDSLRHCLLNVISLQLKIDWLEKQMSELNNLATFSPFTALPHFILTPFEINLPRKNFSEPPYNGHSEPR